MRFTRNRAHKIQVGTMSNLNSRDSGAQPDEEGRGCGGHVLVNTSTFFGGRGPVLLQGSGGGGKSRGESRRGGGGKAEGGGFDLEIPAETNYQVGHELAMDLRCGRG